MTQPIGTPDWTKSVPGGTHKLVDDTLGVGPNAYTGAIIPSLAYSGLYTQVQGTGVSTVFVVGLVNFYDDPAGALLTASYKWVMRANQFSTLNVPVLGPYAQVTLAAAGGGSFTASRILMIGHNGGPSSSVRPSTPSPVSFVGVSIAAGGSSSKDATIVAEGPAHVTINTLGQPGNVLVSAIDETNAAVRLVKLSAAANSSASAQIWVPPQPIQVTVSNTGAALDAYGAAVWLGRN